MTRVLVQRTARGEAPVEVGSGLLGMAGARIATALAPAKTTGILVIADEALAGTGSWAAEVVGSLRSEPTFASTPITTYWMRATESNKSVGQWQAILERAVAASLDRHGLIVAIGGGIVTDLAGFAASTYMRGINWVAIPTTLLSMVDGALGGKTAVNLPLPGGGLGKNLAGAFWPPSAVLCDVRVLSTLSPRQVRAGLAECLKHAMISDPGLVPLLEGAVAAAASLDAADQWKMIDLVARSAKVKLDIVAQDEREGGIRRHLNLGHTFAHAIEAHFHDDLNHGEAVAIGLVAAAAASRASGRITAEEAAAIKQRVASVGLPTCLPRAVDPAVLLAAARSDKKGRGGRLNLVLPLRSHGVEVVSEGTDELFIGGVGSILP